jgi:predicted phage tail protein
VSADINNNLNAMYSIKVAVDSNGNQYAAGMGIGVQNTPAGMQSQVLFLADRFAVMTQAGGDRDSAVCYPERTNHHPDTVIGDGTIGNAKIGSYIQSSTWDGTEMLAGISISLGLRHSIMSRSGELFMHRPGNLPEK